MSVVGWAKQGTRTSGTGDLELVTLPGETPYRGSNAVQYVIRTPLGAYEEGLGRVEGAWLRSRTVTASSELNALISVPQPPSGVVLYLTAQVASVSGGGNAGLVDGDYGAFTVSGNGTTAQLNADAVDGATHVADDSLPVTKLESNIVLTTSELKDALGVPQTDGKVCDILISLYGVANGTYPLDVAATFPYTINSLVMDSLNNNATATVQIDGVTVTGLSNRSITTTISTSTATAANVVSVGQVVTLVLTNIGTTANLVGKLRVTRG
jgi:hypothetical protein